MLQDWQRKKQLEPDVAPDPAASTGGQAVGPDTAPPPDTRPDPALR
jgi:hypothetical protein